MANGNGNNAGLEARSVAGAITSMGIDEMISKLAIGIARGQMELDRVCMEIAQFMGEARIAFGKRADSDEPDLMSLIELGFTPNFYQFVDTVLEIRVAVSSKFQESREYDTSSTQAHTSAYQQQSEYESQSSGSSSSWGYGAGGWSAGGGGWGWGWGAWGYGAGGSSSASSNQSRAASSSAVKTTDLALTTVDAKYASTYNYAVEASSLIKTKIVPVPPPEVFDEIVRGKVKERKQAEQQQRWRKQVVAIMGEMKSSAETLLADPAMFPDSAVMYQRQTASALGDALSKMSETYGGLTTDHWAVVNSVQDRSVTDAAIAQLTDLGGKLVKQYPENANVPDAPDEVLALLAEIESNLGRLRDKAGEVALRLAPPPAPAPAPAQP